MTPDRLPESWRSRAAELERYSPPAAEAFRAAADELEEALRERAGERLTLQEAAEESGYSTRRLRELLAEGTIPQAGRKGAPRIRRGDLPIKPGAAPATGYDYDVEADADALAGKVG